MDDEKKTRRKIKRFTTRLFSSKGILCTDVRGPNIIICNAGQATGLDKKYILELVLGLPNSIEMPKFIAEKGETYSFLVFNSTENSSLFYDTYNGKSKFSEDTAFYMCFVETVPNTDVICYHPNPKGLQIIEDFITPEEELQLIKLFDWDENDNRSNLKNRLVKHYGYEFRYGTNDVDLHSPLLEMIPKECNMLWMRLKQHGLDVREPDQLTVNKYTPGHGIPNHVDNHSPFGDTILSLSLGSTIVMDWKHHSNIQIPIIVKARSMLVMQGEARYDWQHGIQSRTWDPVIENRPIVTEDGEKIIKVITSETIERQTRISLTFRWTRTGPCECEYKTMCDSVEPSSDNVQDDVASNLEELHVHQVYEKIAGHFSTTRHKPWPRVVDFMRGVPAGSVLLDLGCGNGKNILTRNDILQIAGERSDGLLRECRERLRDGGAGSELLADCVRLDLLHAGLIDACADVIICIAVIHHFSSVARRLQAIATICRLLRPGGKALITVWAKDQTKSNYLSKTKAQTTLEEQHVTVNGISFPVHENRTQFQHNDVLVPWKLRQLKDNKTLENIPKDTLLRFYHVFEEGELDELCRQLPLKVEQTFYEEGNWCVVVKK
ncbi:unnamed protein product [Diatraea saccharalis]|uniref:Fe2OG dioxygenase domain-containing protein n=1 Tax=Diatraea saccharalis TaxID=40085 RepID=A0A9P0C5S8_9NEOP|nr:unnamed protein product [Diatraea saccharalis]